MTKYPEILRLMKDMIMKTKSPLGTSLKTNAAWCDCKNTHETHEKILYSGALYTSMGIVHKNAMFLPLALKNPTKEARLKLARTFTPLSKYVLRVPIFRDKKMESIPKKALKILQFLGYEDVCCLPEEPYNGVLLHDLGFKKELLEYGRYLRDFFKQYGVKEIFIIDPHTYEVFTEVYAKEVSDFNFKMHLVLDILNENIDKLKEQWKTPQTNEKIITTYHDPCIFSKRLKEHPVIDQPRNLLKEVENVEFKEPFNHGRHSRCCGGPIEFIFMDLSKEVAKIRFKQFTETGAQQVITACPICYINFDRVRPKNVKLIDLIDFIYQNMEWS